MKKTTKEKQAAVPRPSYPDMFRTMRVGESFSVPTNLERVKVNTAARILRECGVIKFRVQTTRQPDGTFKVEAVAG